MTPREVWCNEAQERYVLAIAPADLDGFRALCERERCPFAVVGVASEDQRLVVRRSPVRQRAGGHGAAGAARQAAAHDPRGATACSASLRPFDAAGIEIVEAARPRAAAPGGRRQDLPDHDRRSHRRRPGRARPDGRALAGAGRGLRHHPRRLRRLRGRGLRDRRARAARASLDAPASGRMAVAEALTNIAAARDLHARTRQALRQLDGGRRRTRRGRGSLRHRQGRRPGSVSGSSASAFPSARTRCPCARPGGGRSGAAGRRAALADRLRVRARATTCAGRWTPQLRTDAGETDLVLVDLANGRARLGRLHPGPGLRPDRRRAAGPRRSARACTRFFAALAELRAAGLVLAYHDRSDGGLFVAPPRWRSPATQASRST